MPSPFRLTKIYQALTAKNPLLKRKLKLGTSEIPIPPKKQNVIDIEAINKFNERNPRINANDIQPVVKQSAIKQSNVGEPDEGVIQGAFDTATMEARDGGYPPPIYEAFKKRYLKRNLKADGGRAGYEDGGMLVQPSDDGSRPGYKDETFTVGSGPGTGDALKSDRNTKIVKTALNKIKKQINNKPYFEWSEKSDWYKKLQAKLGGKAEGVGMNRDFTNQLINKTVNENFPGSYHGKNAMFNLRNDMVVNGFVEYLKDNGEFDGGEKFLKSLEKFEGKDIDHKYERINSSWKSWIAGEFEVEGIDRVQLKKELKARNIDYNKIDNWNPSSSQKRGLKKKAAIEFLDNQNNKFPNRSFEDVQKLYKQKFPDRNIYLDVNTLTDIKRTGIYKSGDSTTSKYKSVSKGNRSNWLKESYGQQFQGNYSKLIKAADQLEAAGEFKKAKRISDAADKFFGPKGIITNAKGEGEHALARLFDVYGKPDINGNILPNPNRQLAINSLVSGDLNQFKKNFFDVPVKRFFDEYNNPETTAARRKELKTLIEDRKKTMNSLTGGQTKGIVAGDTVKFQYTPDKIIATSNVEAIDTAFKKGNFNIDDYIARGTAYSDAFKVAGSEANIFTKTGDIKSTYSKPINEKKAASILQNIQGYSKLPQCKVGAADGGRIGFAYSDECLRDGLKEQKIQAQKGNKKAAQELVQVGKVATRAGLLRNLLGPGAILGEAVYEGAVMANKVLGGTPKDIAWAESYLSYLDPRKYTPEGLDPLKMRREDMITREDFNDPDYAEGESKTIDGPNANILRSGFAAQDQVSAFNKAVNEKSRGESANRFDIANRAAADVREQGRFVDQSKDIISSDAFQEATKQAQEYIQSQTGENLFPYNQLKQSIGKYESGEARDLRGEREKEMQALGGTYQDYKNPFTKDEYENFARKEGYLPIDKAYTDKYFTDAILNPMKFEQLIETPGFLGASEKFASGGIASLTDTIPPKSGPTPHGLRYQYNNVKKI